MATAENIGSTWDFGLDGEGYVMSTLDQESPFDYRAYTMLPIPLQIPRIDTSEEPGEQSLGELWPRSQNDWSGGMGQEIFDGQNSDRLRSEWILAYDPFLKKGRLVQGRGAENVQLKVPNVQRPLFANDEYLFSYQTTTLVRFREDAAYETRTITQPQSPPTLPYHNMDLDESYIYYGTASGIYRIQVDQAWGAWVATEAKINNLTGITMLQFGKGRLIAGVNNSLHVIDDLTSLTSGATAHYIQMDTGWKWNDAEDLGHGIYLCGESKAGSRIYLMSFDTSDAASGLTIGIPREIWRAPPGEQVYTIKSYAGSGMLIGTSRGVRNVNIIDRDGNVNVGPLIETNTLVADIGVYEDFAYAVGMFDGPTNNEIQARVYGVWKIDLGSFAYAQINYGGGLGPSGIRPQGGVVIPPWFTEGNMPAYRHFGTWNLTWPWSPASNPGSTQTLPGEIRFGTLAEKELRRIEVTLDLNAVGYYTSIGAQSLIGSINSGSGLDVDNFFDNVIKIAANDWRAAAAAPGDIIIAQQQSDSDYRWQLRIDSAGTLIFRYLDDTDTVRTFTATDVVGTTDWDNNTEVWIRWNFFNQRYMQIYYYLPGVETDYPDEAKWTQIGAQLDLGASFPMKNTTAYQEYPIEIKDIQVWGDNGWWYWLDLNTTLYDGKLGVGWRDIAYRPIWNRDESGNSTWTGWTEDALLGTRLYIEYRLDDGVWTKLVNNQGIPDGAQVGTIELSYPDTPDGLDNGPLRNWSIPFPADTRGKIVELNFSDTSAGSRSHAQFVSWRLMAEPVPQPRYYRHVVPVMLYDKMTTLDGRKIQRRGLANDLKTRLETLYRAGSAVDFQPPNYFHNEAVIQVRVEEFQFKEYAPPKGAGGFGGIGLLVLKELDTGEAIDISGVSGGGPFTSGFSAGFGP